MNHPPVSLGLSQNGFATDAPEVRHSIPLLRLTSHPSLYMASTGYRTVVGNLYMYDMV